MVRPLLLSLVFVLSLAGCHKEPPPPPPKPLAPPAPRRPQATLFDHAMLTGSPARPRPDCSPEALMAAARHVGELEAMATGAYLAPLKGKRAAKDRARSAACPTPEAQLALNEVKGALPGRVSSCMSQDAPLDPEWDMVNSAVIGLSACLDCSRSKDERATRCKWVADQVKRAEQSVKTRAGQ